MKRIISILSFLILIGFCSCDDEINFTYQGKSGIQFKHFDTDFNGKRTYYNNLIFSFGLRPDSITTDTAKVVVEFIGNRSATVRKYNIEIDADSTTAVAGVHYKILDNVQSFRANAFKDTIRIVVYRENLSKSFLNPVSVRLDLVLKASDDFDLGMKRGQRMSVYFNDYLSKPSWWDTNFSGSLDYYNPEKWKVLILLDKDYAVYSNCRFNLNNEGRQHIIILRQYLENEMVIDKEQNARVYIDHLEPLE